MLFLWDMLVCKPFKRVRQWDLQGRFALSNLLNCLLQGEPGYANETVLPGDHLLRVDGGEMVTQAGGDPTDRLIGAELSPTHLVLRRQYSGRVYGVRICIQIIFRNFLIWETSKN
jgi:hypothetical protein